MTPDRQLGEREFVLRGKTYLPLVIGGMGVGISTKELALSAERIGAIGHLSDAMLPAEADRQFSTRFVATRMRRFKHNAASRDKSSLSFDLGELSEITRLYIADAVDAKTGKGGLFVNCMEKLSMSDPRATLKVRLQAAMDAGIDGITLSAGLHLSTLALIASHPRFRDVSIGIVVSSLRALKLFLKRAARVERRPDYVIVEGPLAGGHLGFGEDWREHHLATIVTEVLDFLKAEDLDIPIIAAGGIFTGDDALEMLDLGCAAVQVATRFAIALESGLPDAVKEAYIHAGDEDVIVDSLSPTGYPMRLLRGSPALQSRVRPNCEAYGYLLDQNGNCAYLRDYWNNEGSSTGKPFRPHTCLCTEMRRFRVWTCGTTVSRLKTTLRRDGEGKYILPSAKEILDDYLWGREPHGSTPVA